ncbi:hypothetical protein [Actinoplanes sp. G11-F43]
MQLLAVVGGGGSSPWPPWAVALFIVVFVAVGIFVIVGLIRKNRRR